MDPTPQSFNASKHAVIVMDLEGVITAWNGFAEALFGWSATEALGRNAVELLVAPERREKAHGIMKMLARGESWGGRFTARHRAGHDFDIFVVDAPWVQNGRIAGIVSVSIAVPELRANGDGPAERLTGRERQIASLTARGQTSPAIADALGISVRTVESHRSHIYRKLGIGTRAELIVLAALRGFLTDTD